MPGSGARKRAHADAKRAAKMRALGFTTRHIARLVGCRPGQVKALVILGERLKDEEKGQ